jgi:hypothetical protein
MRREDVGRRNPTTDAYVDDFVTRLVCVQGAWMDLEVPDGMVAKEEDLDNPWEKPSRISFHWLMIAGRLHWCLSNGKRVQDAHYRLVLSLNSRLDSFPREVHPCQGRARMADVTQT